TPQALQRGQSCLGYVGRIGRTEGLAQDISDPARFDNGTNGLPGDDTSAWRSGAEEHARATVGRDDFMRDSRVSECDPYHVTLGVIAALADGVGDFAGLAEAQAYFPLFVTHHHERTEAEAAATLNHFCRTVDENNFFTQLAAFFAFETLLRCFRRPPAAAATSLASATTTSSRLNTTFRLIGHNLFLGSD